MTHLQPGDPAPWFVAASCDNPGYVFNSVAGRYVVLCFLGSAGDAAAAAALRVALMEHRNLFDDESVCLFTVSTDPEDRRQRRLHQSLPGIRCFWDTDLIVSGLYGAVDRRPGAAMSYCRFWLVLDPLLRVLHVAPLGEAEETMRFVASLPSVEAHVGIETPAPVLVLPRVLEPEFCQRLIKLYQAHGGTEIGFMRDVGGRTVGMLDASHKRRRDCFIEDPAVQDALKRRIARRLVPEIAKAFSSG